MSDTLIAETPSVAVERLLDEIACGLKVGELVPYLGPGVLDVGEVPVMPEEVARELNRRVAVPGRIRTNLWATAQFIEQRRHRKTLVSCMSDIFARPVAPTPLHRALARLAPPLIVDTWYDGAMRSALGGNVDWIEIQGVSRALETRDIWFKAYGPTGEPRAVSDADQARTILYKPHGAITPAGNFLVADSDYVEVLTEIDIQSPIPEAVKQRRSSRGFVFIGCRFHDQLLRTYARQIIKRSAGPRYVIGAPTQGARNELKFFEELGAVVLDAPIPALVERLT